MTKRLLALGALALTALFGGSATAQDGSCSKSACAAKACDTTLVAVTDAAGDDACTGCPGEAGQRLVAQFAAADAKLASLCDEGRAKVAAASSCGAAHCPLGQRMEPTLSYLQASVEHVQGLHDAMAEMDMSEVPQDLAGLLAMRATMVASLNEVLGAQQMSMVSMTQGGCASMGCQEEGVETLTSAGSSCGSECGDKGCADGACAADTKLAAKTDTCSASCGEACQDGGCAATKLASKDECNECGECTESCVETKVTVVAVEAVAAGCSDCASCSRAMLASKETCDSECAEMDKAQLAAKKLAGACTASECSECSEGASACATSDCSAEECSAEECSAEECTAVDCSACSEGACSDGACVSTVALEEECCPGGDCGSECGEEGFSLASFETRAEALMVCGDGLIACWNEVPAQLASLSPEAQAQLGQAGMAMMETGVSMDPMMNATAFYAETLETLVAIDAQILALMEQYECGCTAFQASSDLLAKNAAVAATLHATTHEVMSAGLEELGKAAAKSAPQER